MSIDWFTFAAQLFNFLLLVWLLSKYLFKPILKVVEERGQKIKKDLEDAAMREEDARKEKALLAQNQEAFEREKGKLLSQAIEEAKQERERLIAAAREEYESARASFQEELKKEREAATAELRDNIENEILALARKAVEEVAHTSLEEQIAEVFLHKMGTVDAETKTVLISDMARSSHPVALKSAFELPPSVRQNIEKRLQEILGQELTCSFEINPAVVCGIEMVTANRKIEWHLSKYLASFRATL